MKRIFTFPPQPLGRILQSSALPRRSARQAIALCLVAVVLHLSTMAAFASDESPLAFATGEVTAAGDVSVNGAPAITGQTLFSGSVIATTQNSLSTLSLSNLSRLELTAETTLKLDFSAANVAGSLDTGQVRVSVPPALSASITTANASIMADAAAPAVFNIEVERGTTTVSVQAGRVEMRVGDRTHVVAAGESLAASANSVVEPPAQSSNRRRRAAWWLIGAGVVATVVIILLATRDDAELPPSPPCTPITLSPSGLPGCL